MYSQAIRIKRTALSNLKTLEVENVCNGHTDIMYPRTFRALEANNLENIVLSCNQSIIKKSVIEVISKRFPSLKKLIIFSPQPISEDSFKYINQEYRQITELVHRHYHPPNNGFSFEHSRRINNKNLTRKIISNVSDYMETTGSSLKFTSLTYYSSLPIDLDDASFFHDFCKALSDFCNKVNPPLNLGKILHPTFCNIKFAIFLRDDI